MKTYEISLNGRPTTRVEAKNGAAALRIIQERLGDKHDTIFVGRRLRIDYFTFASAKQVKEGN